MADKKTNGSATRVRDIFPQARELPEGPQREEFLDSACGEVYRAEQTEPGSAGPPSMATWVKKSVTRHRRAVQLRVAAVLLITIGVAIRPWALGQPELPQEQAERGWGDLDKLVAQLETSPFDYEGALENFQALCLERPETLIDLFEIQTAFQKRQRGTSPNQIIEIPDEALRWTIAQAGETAIPGLKLALNHEDQAIQDRAYAALTDCSLEVNKEMMPVLIAGLTNGNLNIVGSASAALAVLGEAAEPAYPILTNLLARTPQMSARQQGINYIFNSRPYFVLPLVNLGEAAKPAMPLLKMTLREAGRSGGSSGEMIVTQLGRSTGDPDVVMPLLIHALRRGDWLMRRAAALAVEKRREDGASAVPVLKELLESDRDPRVRWALARALAVLDPSETDQAVEILIEILEDRSEQAHYSGGHAAGALAAMGPAAKAALPSLLGALEESQSGILGLPEDHRNMDATMDAQSVIFALGALGPDAVEALPILERMVAEAGPRVAMTARWACIQIQPEEILLIDEVLKELKSSDPDERQEAVQLLGMLKSGQPRVERALAGALDDKSLEVRLYAAMALTQDGANEAEVVSVLRSGLNHKNDYLRHSVVDALGRIEEMK